MEERKRAAAYARVSTKSEGQEHSFEFQSRYWNITLGNDPQYEYVGLYADKGISGKSLSKRPQMLALLNACRRGEIDIVFTKSVQRFARNKKDLLETVRELRDMNIAVYFEKENINTLDPSSEVYLTIAAAVAEDDLERYSQNVAWTIRNGFKQGKISVGINLYGYKAKDCVLEIVPNEAEVVRDVFTKYATGEWSAIKLERYLNEKGIPTKKGCKWRCSQIVQMLKNEKYCGDVLCQKGFSVKGEEQVNKGEMDMYYIENNHPAIVDRETWEKVQAILNERGNNKLRGVSQPTYPFSKMIICGKCGATYSHKINNSGTKYAFPMWTCQTRNRQKKEMCDNHNIKDSVLREKFVEVFNEFIHKKMESRGEYIVKAQLTQLYQQQRDLWKLKIRGLIKDSDYENDYADIQIMINEREKLIREYGTIRPDKADFVPLEKFDEGVMQRFIKQIIIEDWIITFEFYNGVKIKRAYTNGRGGNKKGWKKIKEMKEKNNGTTCK